MKIVDRIYHKINIHAQANARWSYVDPPLATLPPDLRDLYMPDPGWPWFGWDYDMQELRIIAALSKDQPMIDVFKKGWDIHSVNTQDIFGWTSEDGRFAYAQTLCGMWKDVRGVPVQQRQEEVLRELVSQFQHGEYGALQAREILPATQSEWQARLGASAGDERWPGRGCTSPQWKHTRQSTREFADNDEGRARPTACAAWIVCGGPPPNWEGGDDGRRVFAKRFVYRLNYGGDPKTMHSIPGAKALGLDGKKLVRLANQYMAAHPQLNAWRRTIQEEAARTGMTRTFTGRRRCYLSGGKNRDRQALDHPMQAAGQDIANMVVVEIKETFGDDVYYVYGLHDSQNWAIRESKWDVILSGIKLIATQPRRINGMEVPFPAAFKERR